MTYVPNQAAMLACTKVVNRMCLASRNRERVPPTCAVGARCAVSASISEPATSPRANTLACFRTCKFLSVRVAPLGLVSKGRFSVRLSLLAGELPAVQRTISAVTVLVLLSLLGCLSST